MVSLIPGMARSGLDLKISIICTCNYPLILRLWLGFYLSRERNIAGNGNLAFLSRGQRRTPTTVSVRDRSTCRVTRRGVHHRVANLYWLGSSIYGDGLRSYPGQYQGGDQAVLLI